MTKEKSIAVVTGGAGFIGSQMVDLPIGQGLLVEFMEGKRAAA